MADYPLKEKRYCAVSGCSYPNFDFSTTYYAVLEDKLMAVKPIAVFFEYDVITSWKLRVLAANGKHYHITYESNIYRSVEEYLEYAKTGRVGDNRFGRTEVNDTLYENSDIVFVNGGRRFYQFLWDGKPRAVDGSAMFWVDIDGPHYELKPYYDDENTKSYLGKKLYTTQEECLKDCLQIVDFGDAEPEQNGKYTITREFTVKARTREDAERLIDDAITNIKL